MDDRLVDLHNDGESFFGMKDMPQSMIIANMSTDGRSGKLAIGIDYVLAIRSRLEIMFCLA